MHQRIIDSLGVTKNLWFFENIVVTTKIKSYRCGVYGKEIFIPREKPGGAAGNEPGGIYKAPQLKAKHGLSKPQKSLLEKVRRFKGQDKLIRTHSRDMIILPEMIGAKIGIYNGKEFTPVVLSESMLGHYLGEFALTRKRVQRSSKFVPLK